MSGKQPSVNYTGAVKFHATKIHRFVDHNYAYYVCVLNTELVGECSALLVSRSDPTD